MIHPEFCSTFPFNTAGIFFFPVYIMEGGAHSGASAGSPPGRDRLGRPL